MEEQAMQYLSSTVKPQLKPNCICSAPNGI
jgi:hypothetical protein